MARKIEVEIVGDSRSLERAFGRAQKSSHSLGGALAGAGKMALKGAAIAGGVALVGLGAAAKLGFDEFKEAERVGAQTRAVIESTGGVANVTASHVSKLSEALMRKSGVDDEAIASGQNMLLTFKQIKNEAGEGNNIFDKATRATLDLSVAMGTDMSKSAIMVGKALNDPIKGITAMRRVGIQFTEAQEEQIKKMVEAGDVAGAQKLILKELESQFGGSAEAAGKTLPGQLDILKQTFSNTAGEIVGRFVPILVDVATFLAPLILRAMDAIGDALGTVADKFSGAGGVAAGVWPRVRQALEDVWGFIQTRIFPILNQLREIWTTAMQRIAAVLQKHEPELRRIWERIGKAFVLLGKIAIPILRVIFTEVLPRVIGIALKAMDKATGAIEGILKTGKRLADWFKGPFAGFFSGAWERVKDLFFDARVWILNSFLGFAEKMLKLADRGFGWIPGLGGKIDSAREKISGMRDELDRISRRRYSIRFVTNAAKVKSDIEDFRASLPGRTVQNVGDFGSAGFGNASLVQIGRQLQSMGFQVGEHPAFGGVAPVHAPNSYHYVGRALDINWPGGGGTEMRKLDWLFSRLQGMSSVKELLWRTSGHFDHLHLAMDRGGIVPGRRGEPVAVLAHGGETFIPTHKPGVALGGMTIINVNVPRGAVVIDEGKLVDFIKDVEQRYALVNGGRTR